MEPPQVWFAIALLLLQEKMLQRATKIITPTNFWQMYLKQDYNEK